VRWVQADALKLQDTLPLIQYTAQNNRLRDESFLWMKAHTKDADRLTTLVQAFKAKVPYGPKYKFGIRVPGNPYQVILLDRSNGNTLW